VGNDIRMGFVNGNRIREIEDFSFSNDYAYGERRCLELEEVKILPPSEPTKILGIGLNYMEHIKEVGMEIPGEPLFFYKPPSSLIGHGEEIILPKMSEQVEYEGELAIVIGKRTKDVHKEIAMNYVYGYSCFNDVTARDLQRKDRLWSRAKGFDTFSSYGPWIVTKDEVPNPNNLKIKTILNDEIRQNSSTDNLIFRVEDLVSYLSSIMTLEPGEIIATGTPCGVGKLRHGDTIEVHVEKVGVLINKVI